MINNYIKHPNGVISQIDKVTYKYDKSYISTYNSSAYSEKSKQMGFLRLGFLLGAIGKIPKSILDVGYGNGDFLNAAKTCISSCFGNDISGYPVPTGVAFADNIYGQYDVISFFDVLEHFDDPTVIRNLNAEYVYVSLPNCEYQSDEWFETWKHRKPNEHLHHFNKNSLCNFFEENGYELVLIGYPEDAIRKNDSQSFPNILSAIFKKV